MAVKLLKQKDGRTWRPDWYGAFDVYGKRTVVNTKVKWKGSLPASGSLRDAGDPEFEETRKKAKLALERFQAEAVRKGHSAHLVERLIEAKTGQAVEHVKIVGLADRWLSGPRSGRLSERHAAETRAALERFSNYMAVRNRKTVFLYQVTPADAGAFIEVLRGSLAPRTVRKYAVLLQAAFKRCLPVGVSNPFEGFSAQESNGTETVHRKPFTAAELQALIEAAKGDGFMYDLITAAACTGMRRGDLCRLPWSAVDLAAGMLDVKTSKTGAGVEIPIFEPLRQVLESRKDKGSAFVFPEAARMLVENPTGLTYRFKMIIAKALDTVPDEPEPEMTDAADIEEEGVEAILANVVEGSRRDRILETFRRYCAGEPFREIEKAIRHPRATISADLHAIEAWTGSRFVKSVRGPNKQDAISRTTRVKRERGQKSASVRDWHALRTTWVTIALTAGVPMELVRRVTGHATVDVVLRHYFRPGRDEFKAALTGALPAVLTGGTAVDEKALGARKLGVRAAEELARLAGKLAAGSASEADRARLRELAAGV